MGRVQDPWERGEPQHPRKESQRTDGHWWLGSYLGCGAHLDDDLHPLGLEAGEFSSRGFRYVGEVFSGCFLL